MQIINLLRNLSQEFIMIGNIVKFRVTETSCSYELLMIRYRSSCFTVNHDRVAQLRARMHAS